MICHVAGVNLPQAQMFSTSLIYLHKEQQQQHRREEERFIIQASAFKTPCRCEAEAHHILHRHAETTHQPGLILRSKGCIGTGWRYRCRCLSSFFLKIGDPFLKLVEFMCRGLWYAYRSLRSLAFFKPPKAILVPGMYFLGFSRYSN